MAYKFRLYSFQEVTDGVMDRDEARRRAAEWTRRYRERLAAGKMVLQIEIDAVAVADFLIKAEQLNPLKSDDRHEMARALERLLAELTRIECEASQRS
jgi:RNA polymerase-interacting CarD/CdnL/TRCF family regulator